MEIEITLHAKERMQKYNVSESFLKFAIENPSSVIESYGSRIIYQRRLNGYILRIIVEESKEIRKSVVITVYKAKSERYEI